MDRLLELASKQMDGESNVRVATLHENGEAEARDLLDRASKEFNAVESVLSSVRPVVGAHAGPGTVRLAFIAGMQSFPITLDSKLSPPKRSAVLLRV